MIRDRNIRSITQNVAASKTGSFPMADRLPVVARMDADAALKEYGTSLQGLTPEMLPMIVTTGLARGAVSMARHKTVIKHLNSIQNFGAMDVLCTDKTGTLTQNKIILERHLDIGGNDDDRVLRHAYLNSYYQTGFKNLIDVAVLEHGDGSGLAHLGTMYEKVDEIPFDFSRRRMSVVLRDASGKTQMVTKGAVEEIRAASPACCTNPGISGMSAKMRPREEFWRMAPR